MDDDTMERKKREAVTETRRERLKKKRTKERGSKDGKATTEQEGTDADD